MHYDPRTDNPPALDLPLRCTGPRPLAWLSSSDADGRVDLSIFPHWQWLAPHASVLLFSAPQAPGHKRHRAVDNIEQTGWFVWNMATTELRDAVLACQLDGDDSLDAFSRAGVAKAPSIHASCPRVAQSPAHLECRYLSTQRLPGQLTGHSVDLVFAEVARVHLRDELLGEGPSALATLLSLNGDGQALADFPLAVGPKP